MSLNRNGHNIDNSEGKSLFHFLRKAAYSLIDLIPPYCTIVGELKSKEVGPNSSWYVIVGEERISVDPIAFDTLQEGERVKIRSTRRKRAISIERLSSGDSD